MEWKSENLQIDIQISRINLEQTKEEQDKISTRLVCAEVRAGREQMTSFCRRSEQAADARGRAKVSGRRQKWACN